LYTLVLIVDALLMIEIFRSKGSCMNKAQLVERMAKSAKTSKAVCKDALEAFIASVGTALKTGKPVVLTGFGTFSVMKRKARTGVNPATGKKMQIPAKKVPKFKPGKALKGLVG
jgi:DNA-binding protein HU-beta